MKIKKINEKEYKLTIEQGDRPYSRNDFVELSQEHMNAAYFLHSLLLAPGGIDIIRNHVSPMALRDWFIRADKFWDAEYWRTT